jgi:release factor glutamine methyltransferase
VTTAAPAAPGAEGSGGHGSESDGPTITWRQLWVETGERLGSAQQARWLCEDVGGFDAREWLDSLDLPVGERAVARLDGMVDRLESGEPFQYVLGHWGFRRLDLMVDSRVLIPRPETELLVEMAIAELSSVERPWAVADLGTGSGAIALAIADELPLGSVTVWATDASTDALDVARANLAGLGRRATAVHLAEGSWWAALPLALRGTLSVVVSNPPYIAPDDPGVEDIVRGNEPHRALFSGDDGLDAVRVVVAGAAEWLRPGGLLLCEIGSSQGAAVADLARASGLTKVEICADLTGRDRVLRGRSAL